MPLYLEYLLRKGIILQKYSLELAKTCFKRRTLLNISIADFSCRVKSLPDTNRSKCQTSNILYNGLCIQAIKESLL